VCEETKRKAAALILSASSILLNSFWVALDFYFYGLRGRSSVLYGRYTLLQTFSFHPTGWVWWTLVGLQVFAVLTVASGVIDSLSRVLRLALFTIPAIGLLLLDAYIAYRWATPALWTMYVIGALPSLLLMCAAVCYAKS